MTNIRLLVVKTDRTTQVVDWDMTEFSDTTDFSDLFDGKEWEDVTAVKFPGLTNGLYKVTLEYADKSTLGSMYEPPEFDFEITVVGHELLYIIHGNILDDNKE